MHFSDDNIQTTDTDPLQLLALIWARINWVLLAMLLCGIAGFVYGLLQVPQYSANALVQLESRQSGVQLSADIADMLAPESEAQTEIEILKTRLVLDKVVDNLGLAIDASPKLIPVVGNFLSRYELPQPSMSILEGYAWHDEQIVVSELDVPDSLIGVPFAITKLDNENSIQLTFNDGYTITAAIGDSISIPEKGVDITIESLRGRPGAEFLVQKLSDIQAVSRLRSGLSVKEKARSTGILEISMVTDSTELSERIVAEVVDAYVLQNISRSAEEADRSLGFLNEQLPIVQQKLREAESVLNEYRLESESIDLNLEAQSILERTVALDAQLSGLALEETELSRRYTRNHPTYRALLDKKQQLLNERNSLGATIKSLPSTQQEILSKTRDVEVSQQIYLQLLNKSQELSVMKAGAVGNVRLLDPSVGSRAAISPRIPLITAITAIAGALLSCGWIVLRHNISREIDNPDDLKQLALPTYAVIPYSSTLKRESQTNSFPLLAKLDPNDMAVEALRGLRTSLYFGLPEKSRNVICVTGPSPTVGKSFVSSNLAYLAAQSGIRVLVIDADLRRGNLGRHFGMRRRLPGLSEVLNGSRSIESVLYKVELDTLRLLDVADEDQSEDYIKQQLLDDLNAEFTEIYSPDLSAPEHRRVVEAVVDKVFPTIDLGAEDAVLAKEIAATDRNPKSGKAPMTRYVTVIPKGKSPKNPAERLMSSILPDLMRRATKEFDLVIIDTPPVLAATDASIVGRYSDISIMVTKQGETTTHQAEEVIRTFANSGILISGIVINGYSAVNGRYGRYGTRYGYQYQY